MRSSWVESIRRSANSSRHTPAPEAPANIGPSGVSSRLTATASPSSRVGEEPITLWKASPKPDRDSQPWSNAAPVTVSPSAIRANAAPTRSARQ